jgi:signal peptidase I
MPVLTPIKSIPKVGDIIVYQHPHVSVNKPIQPPIRYQVLGHDPDTKQIVVITDQLDDIEKMKEIYKTRNRHAIDDPAIPITCIIARFGKSEYNTCCFTEGE